MSSSGKKKTTTSPKSILPTRFIYVSIFIPFLESTTFIFSVFHPFLIGFSLSICCRTIVPITYSPPPPKKKKEKKVNKNFSLQHKLALKAFQYTVTWFKRLINFEFFSTKTGLNLKIILCLIFILKLQKILRTVFSTIPDLSAYYACLRHTCCPHLLSRDQYDHKNNRNSHGIFGLSKCSSSFW